MGARGWAVAAAVVLWMGAGPATGAVKTTLSDVERSPQAYHFGNGKVTLPEEPQAAGKDWDFLLHGGTLLVNRSGKRASRTGIRDMGSGPAAGVDCPDRGYLSRALALPEHTYCLRTGEGDLKKVQVQRFDRQTGKVVFQGH